MQEPFDYAPLMPTMVQHAEKLADKRFSDLHEQMMAFGRCEVDVMDEYLSSVDEDSEWKRGELTVLDVLGCSQLSMHWAAFDARFSNHVATNGWPTGRAEGE